MEGGQYIYIYIQNGRSTGQWKTQFEVFKKKGQKILLPREQMGQANMICIFVNNITPNTSF